MGRTSDSAVEPLCLLAAANGYIFITLLLTSIIAGAATGYIGAYHFNMLPIHALQANMLAMPIFALVIMPMALLALVLSLIGLEGFAFAVMSWGIETVVAISDYLSNQGEAVIYIAQSPPSALALFTIGLISLCLLTDKWRLLGFGAAFGFILF